MAERVGFEPTIPVKVCPLSRRIVSTTHAPLRKAAVSRQLSAVSKKAGSSAPRIRSGVGMTTIVFGPTTVFGQRQMSLANDERPTALKKRLQHFCAAAGQHSAANLDLMVQLRMIQDLHHRMHGPGLRIVRAIYEAPDAGMHQRAGAHGARFNCNKQFAAFQTMVTNGGTGFAQRHDLGVGGRVEAGDVAVPSAAYDAALAYDDRAYRDFSGFESALGAAQGFFHPELVRVKFVRMKLI